MDLRGTRFEAKKEALLRFPDTYFTALLGSSNWKPGKDGVYYIDNDPTGFDLVLAYLRGERLNLQRLSEEMAEAVAAHLDYFLIPLPPSITWQVNLTSGCVVENDIVTSLENGYGWCVLSEELSTKSVRVKVISMPQSSSLYFGVRVKMRQGWQDVYICSSSFALYHYPENR